MPYRSPFPTSLVGEVPLVDCGELEYVLEVLVGMLVGGLGGVVLGEVFFGATDAGGVVVGRPLLNGQT
jgi:hypothetical protein